MTDNAKSDNAKPDTTKPEPTQQPAPAPNSSAQTPVSDPNIKPDGTGTHGRPTDDSDPGHS